MRTRLQAHFQNSPDWLTLFRATKDGAFIYEDLNPATERAYGLTRHSREEPMRVWYFSASTCRMSRIAIRETGLTR